VSVEVKYKNEPKAKKRKTKKQVIWVKLVLSF
jgi:hypothetical protein